MRVFPDIREWRATNQALALAVGIYLALVLIYSVKLFIEVFFNG